MNPYLSYSDLLFTCVNDQKETIAEAVLTAFNEPDQWSARNEDGDPITQYFLKETKFDISLAYINEAERDGTQPARILFWEPRIHPGTTVIMCAFSDGLAYSVFRLSESSPHAWINVRIYKGGEYPGCFFSYYADNRKTERVVQAYKEDEWIFFQKGPAQSFENLDYYTRRLKRDRLNREIITEYMERLGIMIREDCFWQTDRPALFLWQERPNQRR
jgi:hypothetical protein